MLRRKKNSGKVNFLANEKQILRRTQFLHVYFFHEHGNCYNFEMVKYNGTHNRSIG